MTIQEIDAKKTNLLNEVNVLVALKKKMYSNVDIESPMSQHEKELDIQIASIFSEINSLVLQKRKL
jgi:hypothetical protein